MKNLLSSPNSSTFCSNDDFKWTNDFFFLVPGTFQPLTPHQFYWRLKPKLILENTWMHLSKPMINGFLKIDVGSSALLRDCLVWCIQKVHSRVASLSKYRADTLSEIAILIVFMHFRFGHEKDRKYSFSAENSLRVDLLTQNLNFGRRLIFVILAFDHI